jgi:hypothetical protein
MLGSNLSACRVSIKGRGGVMIKHCSTLVFLPFGEIKALNPGGLGAAPPHISFILTVYLG